MFFFEIVLGGSKGTFLSVCACVCMCVCVYVGACSLEHRYAVCTYVHCAYVCARVCVFSLLKIC